MHGTQKRAETLRVLMRGLRPPMSIMFSSSSTFRCIWRSAQRFTLGKEQLSRRCSWTRVNTRLPGNRRRGYRSRYYRCKPSTKNAYHRILHRKMTCLRLLLTAHLSQHEMTAQFAIGSTAGLVTWYAHPAYTCYISTAPNSATVANRFHVYVYSMPFLTQNWLYS